MGEAAAVQELRGIVGHDVAVDGGVEAWAGDGGGVEQEEEGGVGDGAEAGEGVGPGGAVSLLDELVVDGLVPVAAVVPGGGGGAGFLDRAVEERVGAAAVGYEELALGLLRHF